MDIWGIVGSEENEGSEGNDGKLGSEGKLMLGRDGRDGRDGSDTLGNASDSFDCNCENSELKLNGLALGVQRSSKNST